MRNNITLDEIYAKKTEFRKMGMASFTINGMSEDESIRQIIAESWSVCFYAVRDPYHGARGKKSHNLRFRVFQIIKENPQIPMGYYGCPGFSFECHDGQPMQAAIRIMKEKMKKEYTYRVDDDYITLSPILSEEEEKAKQAAQKTEAEKYIVKDTDSAEVTRLKQEIAALQALSAKMKEANKAINKNDDAKLVALGFSEQEIYKLKNPQFGVKGFPSWRLTSIAAKVRRIKSKLA